MSARPAAPRPPLGRSSPPRSTPADSDECAREDACSQHCTNTPGSYLCSCASGYELQTDARSCAALNEPPQRPAALVVVTARDVRLAWPTAPPPPGNHSTPALDVRAVDFLYSEK